MSITITCNTTRKELSFTHIYWYHCLLLAIHGGWYPSGTKSNPSAQIRFWSGSYNTNDGQMIEEDDCKAIANSLQSMIPQIGDTTITDEKWNSVMDKQEHEYPTLPFLLERFGGEHKEGFVEIIEFLRKADSVIIS